MKSHETFLIPFLLVSLLCHFLSLLWLYFGWLFFEGFLYVTDVNTRSHPCGGFAWSLEGRGPIVLFGLLYKVPSGFWIRGLVGMPAKKTCPTAFTIQQIRFPVYLRCQEPAVGHESDFTAELKLLPDPRKKGWAEWSLQTSNHRSRGCWNGREEPSEEELTISSGLLKNSGPP